MCQALKMELLRIKKKIQKDADTAYQHQYNNNNMFQPYLQKIFNVAIKI